MLPILGSIALILASADAGLPSGNPEEAERVLEETIAALAPGLSFQTLSERLGNPAMDGEHWGSEPKSVPWLVVGTHGRHTVIQWVDCVFDTRDELVACRFGDPLHSQTAPYALWTRLREGDTADRVMELICAPECVTRMPGDEARHSYVVAMPPEFAQRSCGGTVVIREGLVASTRITCQ